MAKLKGKGTVLQKTISAVLTDTAQITDIDLSGEASGDFESTTLDGGAYETFDMTGYVSGGTVKFGLFFDPALAGHQSIVTDMSGPTTVVWKLKYSDSGPSSLTFTAAGTGLDQKIVTKDGLKATVTLKRTGQPTRA
jgi:hypothetical protein